MTKAVEIIRPHVLAEHDVIIEVDELLREAWDAMDVRLNGWRAECGKVGLVLEDILGGNTIIHARLAQGDIIVNRGRIVSYGMTRNSLGLIFDEIFQLVLCKLAFFHSLSLNL